MANNTKSLPPPPISISGDIVILVVFFILGTILFVSFARGFMALGQGELTPSASTSIVSSQSTLTLTPVFRITSTKTETVTPTQFLPTATGTGTPVNTSVPSLTSIVLVKTNTPVPYKSSTPKPYKSSTPVPYKSSTPVSTSTRTPTPTATHTTTITPTGATSTETTTTTPTITNTPTETGTPTISPTPTVTATPTITPAGICADPGSDPGLPITDDTWIESTSPTANHSTDTVLSIRADGSGDRRILLRFDLSSLTGTSVANADLYFYINSPAPYGATIFLYKPNIAWTGTQTTWEWAKTGVNWSPYGGDYNPIPVVSTVTMAGCRVKLNITDLVKEWYSLSSANNGIIMIASGSYGDISIPSSRATANRPILLVTMNP